LEAKGWKILRIWSTDWFENLEETKNKLAKELLEIRDATQVTTVSTQHQFIHRENIDPMVNESKGINNLSLNKITPNAVGRRGTKVTRLTIDKAVTKVAAESLFTTQIYVEVGDRVVYEYIDDGQLASAQIVRGTGDPTSGSINRDSALGKALLDAVIGEPIEFLSPKGKINLIVRQIHKPQV
jgi:hypothetical protein